MTNPIHELTAEIMYEMITNLESKIPGKIKDFYEIEGGFFLLNNERVFTADYENREFIEMNEEEVPFIVREMLE